MSRSRCWTFTINNPDEYDLGDCLRAYDLFGRYMVLGFEIGDSGTEHIQGYIYFTNPATKKQVSKRMSRASLRRSKGTADDNLQYCTEDGLFVRFGEQPVQGKVTWDTIVEAMEDPKSDMPIFNQYRRSYYEALKKDPYKAKPRNYMCIGKESLARMCGELNIAGVRYAVGYSRYEGEAFLFVRQHEIAMDESIRENLLDWSQDIMTKYKFGYECRVFDPDVVIIVKDEDREYFIYDNKYLKEYKGYSWLQERLGRRIEGEEQNEPDDI